MNITSRLHKDILRIKPNPDNYGYLFGRIAYNSGHKAARFAAADLAKKAQPIEPYKWTSVKDNLPPHDINVIAYEPGHPSDEDDEGFVFVAYLSRSGYWESTAGGMEVTHWMPIPETPNGS